MSSGGLGLSVWSRALEEHRRLVYPLVVLLIVNVIVFAFVVYPLSQQVANVEERNQAAERELVGARAEHARAAGTLGGKVRATQELGTFYGTVLPSDFAGARRLTHLRVPQMARKASLRYESASVSQDQERGSSLTRFETEVSLTGRWADIRGFLHNLEADPGFVVIDNVQLTEGDAGSGDASIQVTLHLSTYYRTGAAQ